MHVRAQVYAPRLFGQIVNVTATADGGVASGADAADTPRTQLVYTVLVGIVFVLVTPFAVALVDRCGRRVLLLLGGGGMTLSLAGLSALYDRAIADGGGRAPWAPAVCIGLLLLYVACFSFSWGPIAWVLPSETVAFAVRAKVVALGTVCNWVADYAVIGSFLSLTNAVGEAGGFATFAGINAAAFVFVLVLVPETKGRTLEARGDETAPAAVVVPVG